MSSWDRMRTRLRELQERDASPLSSWPDPNHGEVSPPFRIGLRAWAVDVAESLHSEFGKDVELTVGFLSYPACELPMSMRRGAEWRPEQTPDSVLSIAPVSPFTVASGHSVNAPVWVTNQSDTLSVLHTNGHLQSRVLGPDGTDVGFADGVETLAMISFSIAPGERLQVPVRIGTASCKAALGYAVPPGSWQVEIYLSGPDVAASVRLPLTITD